MTTIAAIDTHPAQAATPRTAGRLFLLMVAVVFLLGYLFRWVYLSYYLSTTTILTDISADWNAINPSSFGQAFAICTLPFGIFFLLSKVSMGTGHDARIPAGYRLPHPGFSAFVLFVIAATIIVRSIYGSVLGEQPADIPFGLGTPLYRMQADLFPGLLLLFAEAAWSTGHRRQYWLWVAALAGFNIAMAIVTTSKAGMIYFAVQYVMLMYLTGQNLVSKPLRLFALAVGGLLVFIIAAQLRAQALTGGDAQILISLREGRVVETLLEVAGLVANRIPGTEGLALYCGYDCGGLPGFSWPSFNAEAGRVYTQEVIGVPGDFDFRSPGLVGGSIIIAGVWGGILLAAAFLRTGLAIARSADHRGVSAAARITFCFGLFRFILEGVWAWQDLVSLALAILVIEACARSVLGLKPVVDQSRLRLNIS